ncbi:MAG: potassium transporter Kup [Candidatus Pacebacteria bacterium]|nr:potassium transporter Kup [Candidatus Paceibacterota bacterium]
MSAAQDNHAETSSRGKSFKPLLILTALGIVFGDIGTSPLYAFKAGMDAAGGLTPENIMGIVSLIFWALTIVISIEYVHFIMRADNDGEGGILALAGLLTRDRHKPIIMAGALAGSALLYGDGIITPAISVLSALEGLNTAEPFFAPYIVPLTVVILLIFFSIQRRGTASIAKLFGPIMLLFFISLFVLGIRSVILTPEILHSVNPLYAAQFISNNIGIAMIVIGSVFLVVTGGEALYADMGHVGRKPITQAWFFVVFPALMLNYFGQGAHLLRNLDKPLVNPFYELAPASLVIPLVILSTAATIIASQAMVSGVFSLTKQAIALGRLPRLKIIQTSGSEYGQIYLPAINFMMALGTIILVITFKKSENLVAAYGIAVSGTMVVTSILLFGMMRHAWKWSLWSTIVVAGTFIFIEFMFFTSNLTKFFDGGWLPLTIGAVLFGVMMVWQKGTNACSQQIRQMAESFDDFLLRLDDPEIRRLPGVAVFFTRMRDKAPPLLTNQLKWNHALHETVILMSIDVLREPRVHARDRLRIEPLGKGVIRIIATYGYMQTPDIHVILRWLPRLANLDVDPGEATYYLWSEVIVAAPENSVMPRWLLNLFTFMRRNGTRGSDYFGLPQHRVVEIGVHLEI